MVHSGLWRKLLFAFAIVVLVGLNFYTFTVAYPSITHPDLYGTNRPQMVGRPGGA